MSLLSGVVITGTFRSLPLYENNQTADRIDKENSINSDVIMNNISCAKYHQPHCKGSARLLMVVHHNVVRFQVGSSLLRLLL